MRRTSSVWESAGGDRRRPGARCVRGRGVVRRGSSSSSKKDKARRSSSRRDAISPHQVDPLTGLSNTNMTGGIAGGNPAAAVEAASGWTPRTSFRPRIAGRPRPGPLPARPAARRRRLRHGLRGHRRAAPAAGRGQGDPGRRRRRPERAQREALAAGRLDHPGIVAVFDAGEDERRALPGLRAGPRPHARRAERRRRCSPTATCCASGSRCAARSSTPTSAASCTATSSRRT